jgi:predicted DNA-binding WGR domain protein
MALFELEEGTSRKFYRVELDGKSVVLHWGRIGSVGTRKVIELATEVEAQREYDEQISKRRAHGYSRVLDESLPRDPEAAREKANADVLARGAPLTKNARFHFVHEKKHATVWLEVRGTTLVRGDDTGALVETKHATEREATRARDAATSKLLSEGYRLDAFGKK